MSSSARPIDAIRPTTAIARLLGTAVRRAVLMVCGLTAGANGCGGPHPGEATGPAVQRTSLNPSAVATIQADLEQPPLRPDLGFLNELPLDLPVDAPERESLAELLERDDLSAELRRQVGLAWGRLELGQDHTARQLQAILQRCLAKHAQIPGPSERPPGDGLVAPPGVLEGLALCGAAARVATPELQQLLNSSRDEATLLGTVNTLTSIALREPAEIPALVALLEPVQSLSGPDLDRRTLLQIAACEGLTKVGRPATVATGLLIRLQEAPEATVRRAAARALGAVATDAELAAVSLLEQLARDADLRPEARDPDLRSVIAVSLHSLDRQVFSVVAPLLESPVSDDRRLALELAVFWAWRLGNWESAFRECAAQDPDPELRVLACQVLARLQPDEPGILRQLVVLALNSERAASHSALQVITAERWSAKVWEPILTEATEFTAKNSGPNTTAVLKQLRKIATRQAAEIR